MKSAYEDKDTIDGYIHEREILLDHYKSSVLEEGNPILLYELEILEEDYRRIMNKSYKYKSNNTSSFTSIILIISLVNLRANSELP
jgi:hypothetical protein